MKKAKKVLVVGNFGYANHDLSGQTIKTRVTYEMLKKYDQTDYVDFFDTQTLTHKVNVFRLLKKVVSCDTMIYLPAHGNLKYLFPVYFLLSRIFRFDINNSVIGGWLVPYLKTKPLHRWMLKQIKVVLAETTLMKNELDKEYGFTNTDVLWNFRMIDFKPTIIHHDELRLVFMARIDPNKGLDTIFNFCDYLNNLDERPSVTVDFYGPFSPNISAHKFMANVNKYDFVNYHGSLEPEDINDEICQYDILLLPTHYFTEGLPGTIIDSYTSGLPVIVSDWRHAREFVSEGESGLIVPFENHQHQFNEAIISLYRDKNKLTRLKMGACEFGKKFTGEYAWRKINSYLNN